MYRNIFTLNTKIQHWTSNNNWTPSTSRWHTSIHRQRAEKGILTSLCRRKLSKAFDMRYYWIKDCTNQKQFKRTCRPGVDNMADYFSKHHPPWYHKKMRYKYQKTSGCAWGWGCARCKIDDTHETERNIFLDLRTYMFAWPYTCILSKRICGYTDKLTNHKWRTVVCEGVLLPPR